MSDERGVLRRIVWNSLCPWLILFRSFRLSITVPVLFLATMGTLLTPVGWRVGEMLFGVTSPDPEALVTFSDLANGKVVLLEAEVSAGQGWPQTLRALAARNVAAVFQQFVRPFARLAHAQDLPPTETAYYLFGGLWNILVWAFFAGAITRIAAMQFGREERIGFGEAVRHAGRYYLWYVFAPLFPMLGIVLVAVPIALLGGLMLLDLGVLVGGLVWIVVLLGGLTIAVLLFGLLFGWPLMWPTISCEEGGDAFEAFSHSFSYTFQRPLHYLFFALVTVAFGALCWLLVATFTTLFEEATYWAAAWGAGSERMREVVDLSSENGPFFVGALLIRIEMVLLHTIAVAFNHSFFWCAATAIYLLLRREVDEAEFDEVFAEDEEARYALPDTNDEQRKDEGEKRKDEGRRAKDEGERTKDEGQSTKDEGEKRKDEGIRREIKER